VKGRKGEGEKVFETRIKKNECQVLTLVLFVKVIFENLAASKGQHKTKEIDIS